MRVLHLLFEELDLHLVQIGLSTLYLVLDHLVLIPQLDPSIGQLGHFRL